MSERSVIEGTHGLPASVESMRQDLLALGVRPGMVLLVHSSLSSLGWVCGGAVAVILALEEALGAQGTLVMPAHSGDLSDPARWENPGVPESWWPLIRETMPPYDAELTPTRGLGVIAETFRKQPGVLRSAHPQLSFTARGPQAGFIAAGHALDFAMGDKSPLARVYDLDGWVLLLGVGHANNTSLHLAEYRLPPEKQHIIQKAAPLTIDGQRRWVAYEDLRLNCDDFSAIGADFARLEQCELRGTVAQAESLLMPQRRLVDFGVRWMAEHRE
jgi:aminoglycoside 3-N-acetyltransferase